MKLLTWPKVQDKNLNTVSWEQEEYLRWKAFFQHFERVFKFQFRLESARLMLWNSTSWSLLKLSVQIQLSLYPCDPFLINNCNRTGNIVESNFLLCGMWFKTFYWLQNLLYTAFVLSFWVIFAYPSNKVIIYGPGLDL